ncbi:unnamed protein product [Medioppia subpectinata]|uniref:Uncharacterized protein n=1 Tax=Medioppia subpectinata TaxID=1979941 RepID=A0A7R9L2S9_9ACAR|nr:unnamed protein product [Medioppia subpectinata]CAG2113333.1 unnamed protein product [Medioppia subpectinata]
MKDEPGKGGFWKLDPIYADTLVDGVFKKRRPSQRGSQNCLNSNGTPFRKKSRKKESLKNDCQSRHMNDVKGIIGSGGANEVPLIHDTPPNSTESYSLYGEAANDVVELVTAVNSIEAVSVGQCDSYSYTMHSQSDGHLSHGGYGQEICISETSPTGVSDACMLETDGGDICWNAILTDADLNELSNYTTNPVIHTADSSLTVGDSTATTAQLTAVEPHTLHLVANASPAANTSAVAVGGGLEESELFHSHHNGISRHINCLALRHMMGSDVISATHNVVTCVNPTVNTADWNHWQTFSTVANTDSTDLLIRHINGNCEPIVSPSPPIAYITTTSAPINTRAAAVAVSKQTNTCVNNSNQTAINSSTSATSTQPSSPSSGNFEHTNPLQPWAECKAALEAAALDLESFGTLDVHNY